MKWVKIKYLILSLLILAIASACYRTDINEFYIKTFHKTKIVAHYNARGKIDGQFSSFINGNINIRATFKNGMRNGWCIWYYSNGNKEKEIFYKEGKESGIENDYYESGKLNYTEKWKSGRVFDNEYKYYENGNLQVYNAFQTDTLGGDNGYFYAEYDSLGKLKKALGTCFSPDIFSENRDSIIFLTDKQSYNGINDLYINVANPPQTNAKLKVSINNKFYRIDTVRNSTTFIKNAFLNQGNYSVLIIGVIENEKNKIIKTDTLSISLTKN